jgi:hypothetical protein
LLSLDDSRWPELEGGYRVPFDARPLLKELRTTGASQQTWEKVWAELFHQGDIGQASFAVVPHLVNICREHGKQDWNPYAFVATVELARGKGGNPEPAAWLKDAYIAGVAELARLGLSEYAHATSPELARSILALAALWKGLSTYGEILIDFTEDEVAELREMAFGPDAE